MKTFYKIFYNSVRVVIACILLLFKTTLINAQVSVPNTSPVTESFTGYLGTSPGPNANWSLTQTGGNVFNGTNQSGGTTGGWYGNNNFSFLGTGSTDGEATWILRNNTGYSITAFSLSFFAQMFRSRPGSPTVSVSFSNNSSGTVPAAGALTAIPSLTFSDATTNISTGLTISQNGIAANIPNGDYIYIRFKHSGGTNSDNLSWDNVQFTAVTPQVNIAGISPAAGNIYPGSTDNILQTFSINPVFTGLTLSSLSVNTGGTYDLADLTATPFKLYINSSNSLSGAAQVGTAQASVASGGAIIFSGLSQLINVSTTRYLLLTVDVAPDAVLLNKTINITSTPFSNIVFSAVPVKNGTDPVAAGGDQTIIAGASVSNTGTPPASNIGQSSTDNAIFGFDITPAGTTSLPDFTSLTVTASGSATSADFSNFKIVKDVDASGDYSGGDIVVSNNVAYNSTMTFNITGETGLIANTRYLILADAPVTATIGNTLTLSINLNSDINLGKPIFSTAPYNGFAQTIVNTAITSLTTDYFRSVKVNGNWNTTSTWESSTDNATWHVATLVPTQLTNRPILIQSGTIVTIDSAVRAKRIVVQPGGTLTHTNGKSFTLIDVAAAGVTELTINGTYVLKGTMPVINPGSAVVVNNGGIVRVDDNTGGQSDDFARLATVEFKTGAVFFWNTVLAFETDNITYFVGPNYTTNKPIFRVSQPVDVGSNNPTVFNSKFESFGSNPQFKNAGTKTFRDGFGGTGNSPATAKITHATNSGTFRITAADAVIDGTVILNIDNSSNGASDLEIIEGAHVTISGSPQINIGGGGAASGADFLVNGIVRHNGTLPVYLTYGNMTVNGYIDAATTGTFQANNSIATITNITVGSNSTNNSDNAGTLTLTTGFTNVNTFTMQRVVSHTNAAIVMGSDITVNKLVLTTGIAATGNHLFTYNKTNTLTLPASYLSSYLCTCNSAGVSVTPTGSVGFKINNVTGGSEQLFPISADFVSPNRMAINMNNVGTDDFTVVVAKGDIGNTTGPRINRIWYVKEGTVSGTEATMKLYFTKRDYGTYPFGSAQNDEVEDGFLWADPRFVQKDYTNTFINVATAPSSDVPDYTGSPYGSEIFGLYTRGVSTDVQGVANGIDTFSRFSVVNLGNIILPVSLINVKAYQKDNAVGIDWSALNELNVNRYEIERSADAFTFTKIMTVAALNNGNSRIDYTITDNNALKGNNFYRIKAIDKDGKATYSGILSVNIAGGNSYVIVYPNPVRNKQVNLQLNNVPSGKYQVMIYNYLGQQITTKYLQHNGGSAIQNIVLPGGTKAGMYVVKVVSETGNFSSRIVVE